MLASRSWRGVAGVVRDASTPLQAPLVPCGTSFAILSPFRGEGCLVVQACNVGLDLLASGDVAARFTHFWTCSAEGHTVRTRAVERNGRGTAEIGGFAAHQRPFARRKSRSFNGRTAVHENCRRDAPAIASACRCLWPRSWASVVSATSTISGRWEAGSGRRRRARRSGRCRAGGSGHRRTRTSPRSMPRSG